MTARNVARKTARAGAATRPYVPSLEILGEAGGPVLACEPLSPVDLVDCVGELWMESHLRRGHADVPRDEMEFRVLPARRGGRDITPEPSGGMVCDGLILEAVNPSGHRTRRAIVPDSMKFPALRGAARLIGEGVLEPDDVFRYRFRVDPAGAARPPRRSTPGIVAHASRPPLTYLRLPLAPLLDAAEEVEGGAGDLHRVIYLRSARKHSELASRRGILEQPPVETGALLVGSLAVDPSGELYCLVEDTIEALDAEGAAASLTFSSRTWARVHNIMKARSTQPRTSTHRILGQAHGHNFLPCSPAAGERRPDAGDCVHTATSAFLSLDDIRWMKSVFPGEPWSFGHVWGLTRRGAATEAMYSQFAGWPVRRGYHVIEDEIALGIVEKHAVPNRSTGGA